MVETAFFHGGGASHVIVDGVGECQWEYAGRFILHKWWGVKVDYGFWIRGWGFFCLAFFPSCVCPF